MERMRGVAVARINGRAESTDAHASAQRVEAMVARHGAALLRVANQFSLCHDDALDAYQRALEIYLRRLDSIEPVTEGAWMRVVVKHEAMAIRRARQESVLRDELDLDASVPAALREVEDEVAGGERVGRSVEALRALKPDEARALMLKAQGLSYQEIGRRFGWSYTKVNRSVTEGRAHFMKAYRGIEAGETCERYAGALTALADGTATSVEIVAIRPHLRHCAPCRAAVRELRLSRRRRIALLLPGLPWLYARKLDLTHLFTRAATSDVGTGVQCASASCGGRAGPAVALVGLCLTGVGAAGAVCVVNGGVPSPPLIAHAAHKAPARVRHHAHAQRPRKPVATATPAATATVVAATPTQAPVATATPAKSRRTPTAKRTPPKTKTPVEDEFGINGKASPGATKTTGATATTASAGSGSSRPTTSSRSAAGGSSKKSEAQFGFEDG
jgi:RNA polymerase sigma factor (sigma-70 family)